MEVSKSHHHNKRHAWRKTHKVTWGHAVNGRIQLEEAIAAGYTMLEADVMLQKKKSTSSHPVMAHPPVIPDDAMPFTDWLDHVITHYHTLRREWQELQKKAEAESEENEKENVFGIKLDFKDPDAVEPSLQYLQKRDFEERLFTRAAEEEGTIGSFQIWLNADILQGPGGRPPIFDADSFIALCRQYFPSAVLSVGWTIGTDVPAQEEKEAQR